MTKAELAEKVYHTAGYPRRDANEIVETMMEIIKESLEKGDKVKLSGFGNLVVRSKRERVGRTPHPGEEIKITARKVVTFKASQILKKSVNFHRAASTSS